MCNLKSKPVTVVKGNFECFISSNQKLPWNSKIKSKTWKIIFHGSCVNKNNLESIGWNQEDCESQRTQVGSEEGCWRLRILSDLQGDVMDSVKMKQNTEGQTKLSWKIKDKLKGNRKSELKILAPWCTRPVLSLPLGVGRVGVLLNVVPVIRLQYMSKVREFCRYRHADFWVNQKGDCPGGLK